MDSAQRAIEAALSGRWSDAEEINKQILVDNPEDKEALNRLARSYIELGKISKAIANYKKVLKLDPYNNIAQKSLQKLETLESNKAVLTRFISGNGQSLLATSNLFIEEPGKTKTTSLIHLGDNFVISYLDSGESVRLTPHAHRVSVETENGAYVGRLPDDLSHRIIMLSRGGNKYVCFVRSAALGCVKVFIRETFKSESLTGIPSFPIAEKQTYTSYSPTLSKEEPENQDQEAENGG